MVVTCVNSLAMPSDSPSGIIDLAVATDGSAYALAGNANTLYELVRADTWTSAGGEFEHLAVAQDGSAWGVNGKLGKFQRYEADTGSWKPLDTPQGVTISQIAAASKSQVFGLGDKPVAGELWGYDVASGAWSDQATPLQSVRALENGSLWGIASATSVVHRDPAGHWTAIPSAGEFVALDAAADGWVWAANAAGVLLQYDPQMPQEWVALEPQPPCSPQPPLAIACGDDLTLWVLSTDHALFNYDASAHRWTELPHLPSGDAFADIVVASLGDAWAVGQSGNAYRYTAERYTWKTVSANASLTHIAAQSAGTLWGLIGNVVYRSSGDPKTWTAVAGAPALEAIAAGADGTVLGVSTEHKLVHLASDGSWPELDAPFQAKAVAVGGAQAVFALSLAGVPYAYDGSTWTQQSSKLAFSQIATAADGTTWAIDADGKVFERIEIDGWAQLALEARCVAIGSGSDIWAVLGDGTVYCVSDGTHGTLGSPAPSAQARRRRLAPRWDTEDPFDESQSTHLWILRRAAILAKSARDSTAGARVYNLIQPDSNPQRQPTETFHNKLYEGLYDADFKSPYNGPQIGGQPLYLSHFCDGYTLENYLLQDSPTALTQGLKFFEQAVIEFQQNRLPAAGYILGLATHYFTDLTQPMHAANFHVGSSAPNPYYHTNMETSVLEHQATVTPPDKYAENTDPSPRQLFVETAKTSKDNASTLQLSDAATNPGYFGFMPPYSWAVAQATPEMLRRAVTLTAQFLVRWMQAVGATQEFALAVDPTDGAQVRQMCCLDVSGNLWFELSSPWGWSNIANLLPGDFGSKRKIACASMPGQLCVLAVPAAAPTILRYAYRHGSSWTGWRQMTSQFPGSEITRVAAALDERGHLQVTALDPSKALRHALSADGQTWTPWGTVTTDGSVGAIAAVACAMDKGNALRVMALAASDGSCWYTYRDISGGWPSKWLGLNELSAMTPKLTNLRDVSCAVDAEGVLHVVVLDSAGMPWYAQQDVHDVWQGPWRRLDQLMPPGVYKMGSIRCAADDDLFLVGIDDKLQEAHMTQRFGAGAKAGTWQQYWTSVGRPGF